MRVKRPDHNQTLSEKYRAGLFLLCGFFLFGLLLAHAVSGAVTEDDLQQLRAYLSSYKQLAQEPTDMAVSFLSLLAAYIRYPLLIFLLGFTTAGVVLIPVACISQAFFLSFSVRCFAKAFGSSGVMLALSALGIRCLFTVPCTLFVALCASANSVHRLRGDKGLGKQKKRGTAEYTMRLFWCVSLLFLGVILELLLVPDLIGTVLTELT